MDNLAEVIYRLKDPMKSVVTFQQLREKVEKRRVGCRDERLPLKKIHLIPATGLPKEGEGNQLEIKDVPYLFNQHSWGQFCSRFGIPASYANKVDADERLRIFDYWKKQQPDAQLLVRLRDIPANGKPEQHLVRAVLDPESSRFDHHVMLDHLAKLVNDDMVIQTVLLNEDGLRFSIGDRSAFSSLGTTDQIQRLMKVSIKAQDPLLFGMQVSNSEIEAYNFEIDQMILRLLCTNGVIGFEPRAVYKQSKRYGDILGLREACGEALAEMRSLQTKAVRLYRESRTVTYDNGPGRKHESAIRALFRNCNLPGGGELDEVLMRWERFPGGEPADPKAGRTFTKFGLIDALTRHAQILGGGLQHKYEQAAGRFMASAN